MLQNTMGEPSKSCYNLHPVTRCQVCFALSVSQFLSVSVELHSSWHTTCRGSNPGCTGKRPKADASTPEKTQKKKKSIPNVFFMKDPCSYSIHPFIHSCLPMNSSSHPFIHSSMSIHSSVRPPHGLKIGTHQWCECQGHQHLAQALLQVPSRSSDGNTKGGVLVANPTNTKKMQLIESKVLEFFFMFFSSTQTTNLLAADRS